MGGANTKPEQKPPNPGERVLVCDIFPCIYTDHTTIEYYRYILKERDTTSLLSD